MTEQLSCNTILENEFTKQKFPCVGHCGICKAHLGGWFHYCFHLEKKHKIRSNVSKGTGIYDHKLCKLMRYLMS